MVTFFSAIGGLVMLVVGLPFVHGAPTATELWWGVAAGACGALGAALIYRALAIGPVNVASPVLGVTGLVVPVVFGLVLGERPSTLALIGLALAPLAIVLVSRTPAEVGAADTRRGLMAGLLAGAVIGFFLVFVSHIGIDAGLEPLVLARIVGIVLYAGVFAALRRPMLPPRGARAVSFAAGAFDSLANVAFLWGVQRGSLSLVSTLVSLAPATTVLLARIVLRERWSVTQGVGLAAALAAGALISAG